MTKTFGLTLLICGFLLPFSKPIRADDVTDKELKKLEGVWKSGILKKQRDQKFNFTIQGGYLLSKEETCVLGEWRSNNSLFFTVKVDLRQKEKRLRLTQIASNRDEVENRLVIDMGYEWDGDKLKILWDTLGFTFPVRVLDDYEPIELIREKEAKTPDFAEFYNKPKTVTVKPTQDWAGDLKDGKELDNRFRSPITSKDDFAKAWQKLRGKEPLPKIDFKKEFVVINYTVLGKIGSMELNIIETHKQVYQDFTLADTEKKREGIHYRICVFQLELVEIVEGKIVPKPAKK